LLFLSKIKQVRGCTKISIKLIAITRVAGLVNRGLTGIVLTECVISEYGTLID
jgi:hypothetical protein